MLSIESLQTVCRRKTANNKALFFAALLAEIMPLWAINTPATSSHVYCSMLAWIERV